MLCTCQYIIISYLYAQYNEVIGGPCRLSVSCGADLVGLWAGEAAGQGPTAGRQGGGQGGAAVGQDGLQVAGEG